MLSPIFLSISLVGAEWVLYLLLLLSVLSVALMLERWKFYRDASRDIVSFRSQVRASVSAGNWTQARTLAEARTKKQKGSSPDLESEMALALIAHQNGNPEILTEIAQDAVMRARVSWEKNLSILATIGSNAPFVGLFGTVLGIMKAFHELSQTATTGVQTVTSGISEALVATAFGLLVAIPAVVAFNIFQRRVKTALTEAEATKSFLVGKLAK